MKIDLRRIGKNNKKGQKISGFVELYGWLSRDVPTQNWKNKKNDKYSIHLITNMRNYF